MIDKLRSIAVFASVVDQGSFRAAAGHLRLAPSRVSEIVSALERDLGVTLLYRSTRQLSLTHEGRLLHARAQDMLAAAEDGLDAINPMSADPAGALRIAAPAFIAQTGLMDSFAAFARLYPKVDLYFEFSDQRLDLIREGFDLSIRAGWPQSSDLMSRKIGTAERMLVAGAAYHASRPAPKHPRELEDWDWVRFVIRPDETIMTSPDGMEVSVTGRARVSVNTAEALYELAVRGLGLTAIPENLARRGFASGDLVHVLPDWSLRPLGLYAVWPGQSRRENLTTLFVRFLAKGDVGHSSRET